MLSENLQIYRDLYELSRRLLQNQRNVPKTVRYGEYGRAVSMSLDALDMVYVANSDAARRPAALTRLIQLTGGVRARVRLMGELEYVGNRESVNLMYLLDKINRQAVGWRNASHGQSRGGTADTGAPHL